MASPRQRAPVVLLALFASAALVLADVPAARGEAAPTLPTQLGREFLTGLAIGPTEPGGSSTLSFELNNPLSQGLANVVLTFGLYAFNPYPGTGSGPLPVNSGALTAAGSTAVQVAIPVGTLVAGAADWSTPVTATFGAGSPQGTYSIRDSLSFGLNGTTYTLASVGNFPTEVWHNATVLPNGTPTLNLTRLGVSGVIPETAILVRNTTPLDLALYAVLGAAIALALAGAYVAGRRRSGRRSGTRSPPEESQAPSAFGKSRRRDGD